MTAWIEMNAVATGVKKQCSRVISNQNTASHSGSEFARRVQNGIGYLVAACTSPSTATQLTTVSHRAPYRLIPLRSSSVRESGAAVCYLGSYGGGLLSGDKLELNAQVERGAKLGLLTQSANRVYRQPTVGGGFSQDCVSHSQSAVTKSRTNVTVEEGGSLVLAPDPQTLFERSSYEQHQSITAHPDASLCVIDWISAGRVANGEFWNHDHFQTSTKFHLMIRREKNDDVDAEPTPIFIDNVRFNAEHLQGTSTSFSAHSVATAVLYGDRMKAVIQRCRDIQHLSMNSYTLTRQVRSTPGDSDTSPPNITLSHLGLSGRVLVSLSEIPVSSALSSNPVFVARWVASSNEDLYRLFHYCLLPLRKDFGIEFYRDRIRAKYSPSTSPSSTDPSVSHSDVLPGRAVEKWVSDGSNVGTGPPPSSDPRKPALRTLIADIESRVSNSADGLGSNLDAFWSILMLADSALPVGSFAHSNGLEAVAQLQLFSSHGRTSSSEESKVTVESFVTMATQSTLELYTPTVIAANQVRTIQEWRDVDHQLHLRLASNAPACRASLDQGRSLLRVGTKWRDEVTSLVEPDLLGEMSQLFDHDGYHFNASNSTSCHLASVFGVVAALHGLNAAQACQLLGYCVARDLVSAAVRMNLLGPIAGVAVLGRAHRAALLGIREGSSTVPTGASSSCAPLLDLIQPCHDLLATRLFRT